jgi:MFS family permease
MKTNHVRRNIILYKLFALFNEPLFWGPILIISLEKLAHMKLHDIYFMESAVMIICVILNVPAGALADVIGRKKTLIMGRILLLASEVGFVTMRSPLHAWIANVLWAFGYSLQSGADVSLLYQSLKAGRFHGKFVKIEGCAVGGRLLLTAFCSLLVGPLAMIDLRVPLYCCLPFMTIPLIVSFFFEEPRVAERYSIKRQVQTLKNGFSYAISSPEIRWMIGFSALLMGASKVWFFTYNPYFEAVKIPLTYYGVIFFLLNIVAWAFSHWAHRIKNVLTERSCVASMIACVGIPIVIMGLLPYPIMAYLVICQNVVRGFMRPFSEGFMNRHIESESIRVTVLSTRSALSDMVTVMALAWFGFMEKGLSLLPSLTVLGIAVLVLGRISYVRYRKLSG